MAYYRERISREIIAKNLYIQPTYKLYSNLNRTKHENILVYLNYLQPSGNLDDSIIVTDSSSESSISSQSSTSSRSEQPKVMHQSEDFNSQNNVKSTSQVSSRHEHTSRTTTSTGIKINENFK